MVDRDLTYLKSIIKYCSDIEELQEKYGKDYTVFVANRAYQYAVSFCLEQIGELAKKLRDSGFASNYPEQLQVLRAVLMRRGAYQHIEPADEVAGIAEAYVQTDLCDAQIGSEQQALGCVDPFLKEQLAKGSAQLPAQKVGHVTVADVQELCCLGSSQRLCKFCIDQ